MKNFLPKTESTKSEQEPMDQQPDVSNEQQSQENTKPSQPTGNRKKRSMLPLNIDDYEKRRSARSVREIFS